MDNFGYAKHVTGEATFLMILLLTHLNFIKQTKNVTPPHFSDLVDNNHALFAGLLV